VGEVELFIHDGGSGLTAALTLIYPHIPLSAGGFTSFAISGTPSASRLTSRDPAFKRELLHHAHTILFAASLAEAEHARAAFVLRWPASQSDLVATLVRDGPHSVAFFQVLARFPSWPPPFPPDDQPPRARHSFAPSSFSPCWRRSIFRWFAGGRRSRLASLPSYLIFNRTRYTTYAFSKSDLAEPWGIIDVTVDFEASMVRGFHCGNQGAIGLATRTC